ncbi:MAG: class I SAM-dependent methyltransferase [Myxococcota bacterium]|nr:class I SAM-dependent methyltransferase [Myxococcota bacterium]
MNLPAPSLEGLTPQRLEDLAAARFELATLGFNEASLRERMGLPESSESSWYLAELLSPHLVLPPEGATALDLLIGLFLVGGSVPRNWLEAELSAESFAALVEAGVLAVDGPRVQASVAMVPVFDLLLLCDRRSRMGARDFVFFPDHSTAATARFLAPHSRTGRLALDVGTGSGALALSHARSGRFQTVIGQDPNPRAVQMARVSAALNGLAVTFEVAGAEALAQRPAHQVDLLTFVFPQLYTAGFTEAISIIAERGDALLDEVYGALDRVLAPGGEAVLFHQTRAPSRTELVRRLGEIPGTAPLRLVWTALPNKLAGAEFGLAWVRRDGPAPFVYVESEAIEPGLDSVASRVAALQRLDAPDWLAARVALRPQLLVSEVWGESQGRLRPERATLIGGRVYGESLLRILARIDGQGPLSAALGEDDSEHTRAEVRELVARGVLLLR